MITADSDSKKYDGQPLTKSTYTYTEGVLASGDVLTAVVEGTITNVGTAANKVTSYKVMRGETDVTANYTFGESVDGELEITKRSVTLTSATDSKTYDGTPLTNSNVTVTGDGFVTGEGASYNVTGTITDPGTADNTFTYTLNEGTLAGNYEITKAEGTLTVNANSDKVTVTITEHSGEAKYDGEEHNVSGYDTEISNPLYTSNDFSFDGKPNMSGTDAGSYPMELKPEDFTNKSKNFTNVEFVIVDGTLEIAKRSVTLTSATDSKTYDGQPLTNDTVTVGGDGFVNGEGATYNVTGNQTLVGSSDNTFTYTLNEGTKAANYEISKTEGTLTVTDSNVPDDLVVTKTVSDEKYALGAIVTFTVNATNIYAEEKTITLSEIDGVTLAQSVFENVSAGKSIETTATYTITEADILNGSFTNTVTAEVGNVTKTADATAKTEDPKPSLSVEKETTSTPENGETYALGETITYKITVKNDGNLTIKNVKVEDELTGLEETIASLAPGESEEFTTSYTVTEEDILAGSVKNEATADGDNDSDDPTDPGDDEVEDPTEDPKPSLSVEKETTSTPENGETYALGETITYKITVKNDGNLTIKNVKVEDELTGLEETIASLAPGESEEFTTSYTVTEEDILAGSVKNEATADGDNDSDDPTDPGDDEVEDPTEDPKPSLSVEKTTTSKPADGKAYVLGEKITYKITVKNDGNLTIKNVKVEDKLTGDEWTIDSLAPNASKEFTAEYTVTEADILAGSVKNEATADGDNDSDDPTDPGDGDAEDPTEDPKGHLTVVKITTSKPTDGKAYTLGEEITYKITVTNDGNLTITDITVTDELTEDEWTIESLAPGEKKEFKATYVVTEEDSLNSKVVNIATAKGTSPDPDQPDVPVGPGEDPEPTRPEDFYYKFVYGMGNEWTKGSTTTSDFRVARSVRDEVSYERFTGIEIDGEPVDPDNYTTAPGSVWIYLKPAYLTKLAEGEHTIKATFTDGEDETNFFVLAQPEPAPHTGDSSDLMLWCFINAASLISGAMLIRRRKKEDDDCEDSE